MTYEGWGRFWYWVCVIASAVALVWAVAWLIALKG